MPRQFGAGECDSTPSCVATIGLSFIAQEGSHALIGSEAGIGLNQLHKAVGLQHATDHGLPGFHGSHLATADGTLQWYLLAEAAAVQAMPTAALKIALENELMDPSCIDCSKGFLGSYGRQAALGSTVQQPFHGRQFFFALVPLERFSSDLQETLVVIMHGERHGLDDLRLHGRWQAVAKAGHDIGLSTDQQIRMRMRLHVGGNIGCHLLMMAIDMLLHMALVAGLCPPPL